MCIQGKVDWVLSNGHSISRPNYLYHPFPPTCMVIFIIDTQVRNNYRLNTITKITSVIKLVNLWRISPIPPAPALAADGHTGALLLQQADVGALLSVRPVSLGPL